MFFSGGGFPGFDDGDDGNPFARGESVVIRIVRQARALCIDAAVPLILYTAWHILQGVGVVRAGSAAQLTTSPSTRSWV